MPPKFGGYVDTPLMCKTFCMHHQADFNRFSGVVKESIFGHHYKNLIITEQDVKSMVINN
jgi:hypothetical protein